MIRTQSQIINCLFPRKANLKSSAFDVVGAEFFLGVELDGGL